MQSLPKAELWDGHVMTMINSTLESQTEDSHWLLLDIKFLSVIVRRGSKCGPALYFSAMIIPMALGLMLYSPVFAFAIHKCHQKL